MGSGGRRDRNGRRRRAADSSVVSSVRPVRRQDRRHRAREAALQILYQWDIGRGDVERAADTFFGLQWPDTEPPSEALRGFASTLARNTAARLDTIDPLIAETAERWRSERMAVPGLSALPIGAVDLHPATRTPSPL